jgi:hypothetical protein
VLRLVSRVFKTAKVDEMSSNYFTDHGEHIIFTFADFLLMENITELSTFSFAHNFYCTDNLLTAQRKKLQSMERTTQLSKSKLLWSMPGSKVHGRHITNEINQKPVHRWDHWFITFTKKLLI